MKPTPIIPADLRPELQSRTRRLQQQMQKAGIEAALIAGNSNLYYLAGRFFRGYVYVPAEGEPLYMVVRPVGLEGNDVAYIRKPEQIAEELERRSLPMPRTLGLEFDVLPYSEVVRLSKTLPGAQAMNVGPCIRQCRMVKTPYEIEQMRQDGLHQAAAYRRIPHIYKPEMTDLQFQIELERVLRLEGCLGYSRVSGMLMEINLGSVLNGENADIPTPYDFAVGGGGVDTALPVGADGRTMLPGTTVMVDMNGAFNGYQTDMTRVWKIGEIPEEAVRAHECSRAILRDLEHAAHPGVPVADLYHRAMKIVEEAGLQDHFMGHVQKVSFIGHGVGIELNELPVITPRSKDILEAGMTLAIEPKFVFPKVGAVGVENTYVVTAQGLESLTHFPEELQDLK